VRDKFSLDASFYLVLLGISQLRADACPMFHLLVKTHMPMPVEVAKRVGNKCVKPAPTIS
jgi:hypothetical protein